MSFLTSPATLANLAHVTPRPTQTLWGDNYLSFDSGSGGGTFAAQFLPEIYEKEVERYGKRTISGFLSMVGAEMPLASDQVIWSEQGRIHTTYTGVAITDANNGGGNGGTIVLPADHLINQGDTVIIAAPDTAKILKCYVTAVGATSATLQPYTQQCLANDGGGAVNFADSDDNNRLFVYGTEYKKGSNMATPFTGATATLKSKDASFTQFSNRPVIIRDQYAVNGSDTAQIGWVEVTTENGASGYLWYLKSEAEARLRFSDYLEMAVIEGEEAGTQLTAVNIYGTEGLFAALSSRGLVYNQPDFDPAGGQGGLSEFDEILNELDKQGGIEENMMFLDRTTSLEIDNMLAAQNSYGSGGTSYGVFNNSEDMALNLGFSGFRRGSYDFYKTDWKYLNDSATRGGFTDVEGVIVPAGTSTVYDESMGKNISRPFLHVRYRASEADDRKLKSWITGSVGGNYTSDLDVMQVNFLSERCLCVQAANNFVLLKNNADVA